MTYGLSPAPGRDVHRGLDRSACVAGRGRRSVALAPLLPWYVSRRTFRHHSNSFFHASNCRLHVGTLSATSVEWLQVQRQAAWNAHEAAVDVVRRDNEAAVDAFLRALERPITPQERDACVRAQAGLDVPEDNPLRLRPHSAVARPEPGRCAPARWCCDVVHLSCAPLRGSAVVAGAPESTQGVWAACCTL